MRWNNSSGDYPLSVTSDTVHALTVYTEGWASGLQLIGLALSNSGDSSDDFAKVNQEVTEYFVDEVVGKQPEDVQALLYRNGLLKRFMPVSAKSFCNRMQRVCSITSNATTCSRLS
jgi:ATP/maltotriose-dependent transcriptional regulator MalT